VHQASKETLQVLGQIGNLRSKHVRGLDSDAAHGPPNLARADFDLTAKW
jgi:hypothetical protein